MKSVIGIVYSPDKTKVLLIQRRDVDIFVLPGGGIDPDELPETAVIREILEESGLKTEVIRLVAEYTPVNRLAKHTYLFETKVISGELTTGEETRSLGFFPLNDLPRNFFHIHKDFLHDALLNRSDVIYKKLTQVNYWELFKYLLRHPFILIRYACTFFGFPLNKK
jgi:ADP-ribose pyrophosphatase YjhB (NUDIX family)